MDQGYEKTLRIAAKKDMTSQGYGCMIPWRQNFPNLGIVPIRDAENRGGTVDQYVFEKGPEKLRNPVQTDTYRAYEECV